VFTSATLAIGDDFTHFAARIGLPEARTLHIESPSTIAIKRDLSSAQHAGATASGICRQVHSRLCAVARGERRPRVPALHQLSRFGGRCRRTQARFPDPPFPVLVQGQAPREVLLNRFRDLGNACCSRREAFGKAST